MGILEVCHTGMAVCRKTLTLNDSEDLKSTINFDNHFTATHVLHPATYLNKLLVSSAEGGLQLWNILTKLVVLMY